MLMQKQSSKLKVLHVIGSISAIHGGPTAAIWATLSALRLRGIEADLVTTDDDGVQRRADTSLTRFTEVNGFRVRFFPRQTRFYTASLPLLRWLRKRITDYDLVHVHGLFGFSPTAAAWCARSSGVPYIIRPAGVLNEWGRENRRPALKRASIRVLEGPLLRSAARVHFTSTSELNQASAMGINFSPVVLPIGIDMAQILLNDRDATPKKLGPRILFLSRIAVVKRVDMLIRAFAQLATDFGSVTLAIAGDGPEDLIRELKLLAASLGIAARIEWLGFVGSDDKKQVLSEATIFVLPSASENYGVAVVEAMAAGIPIVISAGVGVGEIVQEAQAGRIFDGTVDGLAQTIRNLLCDQSECARMAAAGQRVVREQLSMSSFGKNLEQLYDAILHAAVRI